jgi:hypothetical protein
VGFFYFTLNFTDFLAVSFSSQYLPYHHFVCAVDLASILFWGIIAAEKANNKTSVKIILLLFIGASFTDKIFYDLHHDDSIYCFAFPVKDTIVARTTASVVAGEGKESQIWWF